MAQINKKEFRKMLLSKDMGFVLIDGSTEEIYLKTYKQHEDYKIFVNFDKEQIDYLSGATTQSIKMRGVNPDGTTVTATRKTTSNFSQAENMVVLECVNRLLEKGYKPNDLILEKSWASGHKKSEYLDILVLKDNKAHTMIECKTFGKEHSKEKANMLKLKLDGQPDGQLWAYADRENNDVKILCLYSSHLVNDIIEFSNDIIEFKDSWRTLNSRDVFEVWDKTFNSVGIFEDEFNVYNLEFKVIHKLKELSKDTASEIFYEFLKILRHHGISDKPNAFNKILNIFICKIIDEEEPVHRFWWDSTTNMDEFMSILEELYKKGMDRFLDIDITDYSNDDLDTLIPVNVDEITKQEIKKAFRRQKTERSSEFAFREIYNRATFESNALIVKEIVQLIQEYQFRYGHKHQFLGDFFEQLLTTSIKQESGQYFTPVRIAKFICSSLPLSELTTYCLENEPKKYLPLVIDYACGSGHFLTEYMDIEQNIINAIDKNKLSKAAKRELEKGDYEWAENYVYGIEKDYRLAKTTKLNTFLNGDGNANIISADGLAPFNTYEDDLYSPSNDNGKFNLVIANPPYSIDDFHITMDKNSKDCFSLWSNSMGNNIECLFIERTAQLLRTDGNGYAAIIIPDSISFTNNVFFENTRKLLFEKFRIKAILNCTGKCFAATDVTTKILFLQRRKDSDIQNINLLIDDFFKNGKDFTYEKQTNVIHKYLEMYGEGISFEQYVSLILNYVLDDSIRYSKRLADFIKPYIDKSMEALSKDKKFQKLSSEEQEVQKKLSIQEKIKEYVTLNEKEKLKYFLLTFNDDMIIADTLDKTDCQKFIGLTFSTRKGQPPVNQSKENSLVNDENIWNDITKLNYHINKAFLGKTSIIPKELEKHARWGNASELFDYLGSFNNIFKANVKKKVIKPLKKGFIELKVNEIADSWGPSHSPVYDNNYIDSHRGIYPVFSAATQGEAVKGYIDTFDYENKEGIQISTDGVNAGTVTYRPKQNFSIGPANRIYYILPEYEKCINLKYLYHQLKYLIESYGYDWNEKCGKERIESFYIQIPINADGTINYKAQERIAYELDSIEQEINNKEKEVKLLTNSIFEEFDLKFGNPIENEKKWPTSYLDKKSCKNGLDFKYNEEGTKIRCLTVANFKNNFSFSNTDNLPEICIENKITDDYLLQDNDIVFVRSNGNKLLVGRSMLINVGKEPVIYSGFCIRYRNTDKKFNTLFLVTMLKTDAIREKLFGQGSNITNLNQDMLGNLNIIQPPLPEQEEFARFVENINSKKEVVEKEIETIYNKKQLLISKYYG